jgi:hypothetical protein
MQPGSRFIRGVTTGAIVILLAATAYVYFGPRVRPGQVYLIRSAGERIYNDPATSSSSSDYDEMFFSIVLLRSRPGTLPSGANLRVIETRQDFAKVKVLTAPLTHDEGWVSLALLTPEKRIEQGWETRDLAVCAVVITTVAAGWLIIILWAAEIPHGILGRAGGSPTPAMPIPASPDTGVLDRELDTSV